MMIAVEGMDGVGKTEVSKYISQQYGFVFIEKPLQYFYNDGKEKEYDDLMRVANRMYDIDDNVVKTWYFSLGNIYAARMFRDKDIVIDRHFVSNYYWNADAEADPIFRTLIEVSGVPDLTILLYATPETRMERLRIRNKADPDLNDSDKKDDGYARMVGFLENFKIPYVVINTEDKTLDEVRQMIDIEILKLKDEKRKTIEGNYNPYDTGTQKTKKRNRKSIS